MIALQEPFISPPYLCFGEAVFYIGSAPLSSDYSKCLLEMPALPYVLVTLTHLSNNAE